jgi:L-ascorbate metabolism protein UlaG (beta-lactamase superfamily)
VKCGSEWAPGSSYEPPGVHVNKRRLGSNVQLLVQYIDETRWGGALTDRLDRTVRSAMAPALRIIKQAGMARAILDSEALLDEAFDPGGGPLGGLFVARDHLHAEVLFPSPQQTRPRALVVAVDGRRPVSLELSAPLTGELARWLGDWQRGAERPRAARAGQLWDELAAMGALLDQPEPLRLDGEALFVGHATVRVGPAGSSVLVDPFLFPKRQRQPSSDQPLVHGELAPDAVAITHAHPDHYDPGTLLRFGADCPIYVPAVARESVLAPDLAARLAELGFRNVQSLRPGESAHVGQTRLAALPFHGEQPTTSEVLHPEVRNEGLVYRADTSAGRYALCADAGRDWKGDIRTLALASRRAAGPVDVVFGGFRAWPLYPLAYLFTSITRYLLLVPRELRRTRQQIMNGPDDLLDTAEAWGARKVVPYANGGAAWYAEIGLGPDPAAGREHNPQTDPVPEVVVEAARRRSSWRDEEIPSPAVVSVVGAGGRVPT